VVNNKLELLSNLYLDVGSEAFESIVPLTLDALAPRVRFGELAKDFNMLSPPNFFVITRHWLEVYSCIEDTHHSVPADLLLHPKFADGLGDDHGGSGHICLDPLLHGLLQLGIYLQGLDDLCPGFQHFQVLTMILNIFRHTLGPGLDR
jgi:hypothetical protein